MIKVVLAEVSEALAKGSRMRVMEHYGYEKGVV